MSTTLTAALRGITATPVRVEVAHTRELPSFTINGMAEVSARETRERVRSAIKSSGFTFPAKRITVTLGPEEMPKAGAGFDLPIAIGILIAAGEVSSDRLNGYLLAGELSLSGELRPIRGALPMALAAGNDADAYGMVLPTDCTAQAAAVEGLDVRAARTLADVVAFLRGERDLPVVKPSTPPSPKCSIDMADVAGHAYAKRALEVAAAGGHNLLLVGAPGAGKSMLARRLPTILPTMTRKEMLETSTVYSAQGLMRSGVSLVDRRPFRAPHHTCSAAGIVGGGVGPHPGEASLAHNGVLFLDELPEFHRAALEVLRQPLEDGEVSLARGAGIVHFPARFQLVATMNPCPCGYLGDRSRRCSCRPESAERYHTRVEPFLRKYADMRVEIPAVRWSELKTAGKAESSADIRARVEAARERQLERQGDVLNAQLDAVTLLNVARSHEEGMRYLDGKVFDRRLSARVVQQTLRIARTIADLAGEEVIDTPHIAEALCYQK